MFSKENYKAYLALLAIYIIWGTTYLAIRIGVADLPPVLFAGFRWLIAGPVLFVILRLRGYSLPTKKDILHSAVVGLLLIGMGNGLVVFSEQWIPSGLTALLITTEPFWIVAMEAVLPKGVKLNPIVVLGLIFGMAGIALIFGGNIKYLFESENLKGVLGLTIGVFGWSLGTVYSKYNKLTVKPIMGASIQMIIAGLALTIFGLSLGEAKEFIFTSNSLVAFIYLIIFGSYLAYGSYMYAIVHLPISLVSTYAYVNPVIALFLGWLVLGEEISVTIILAAVIIFVGVMLVQKGNGKAKIKLAVDS